MVQIKRKIAVIGAVLDNPKDCQSQFNDIVSDFKGVVKGRMGIPFDAEGVSVISIIVYGTLDEINSLTGKLGNIKGVNIKTSFSKKTIEI
ncbi:putative iron-only hydrogenase system regulator [Paramaledivibacter caminithermalis DSM 15212]|uniref:Putative iron-only hydrogenase system regulator n=2 Tax=Paramaledivibacter TaxID=1884934 RepID=A0A1M6LYI5_PARC5|nr:putative iron-only hydrogenase system regulator [Paramaledivibacter caminithermalis DSM 15212]